MLLTGGRACDAQASRIRPRLRIESCCGLDTNLLDRYYINDVADAEARRERMATRRFIESDQP